MKEYTMKEYKEFLYKNNLKEYKSPIGITANELNVNA